MLAIFATLRRHRFGLDSKKHGVEIAALLNAKNQEIFQRYLELHRLRGYHETARPSYLAPFLLCSSASAMPFFVGYSDRIHTGSLPQKRAAIEDLSLGSTHMEIDDAG